MNENQTWKRRDLLKSLGLATVGIPIAKASITENSKTGIALPYTKKNEQKLDKPLKVIVNGAGSRGWGAYSSYGLKFPKELQVFGVAEPIPYRCERISKAFNIPKRNQNCFLPLSRFQWPAT